MSRLVIFWIVYIIVAVTLAIVGQILKIWGIVTFATGSYADKIVSTFSLCYAALGIGMAIYHAIKATED